MEPSRASNQNKGHSAPGYEDKGARHIGGVKYERTASRCPGLFKHMTLFGYRTLRSDLFWKRPKIQTSCVSFL